MHQYLGGHNDLLAGAVVGPASRLEPLETLRGFMGVINSPENFHLLVRGLKTFALQLQRHNANGQAVAEFLEDLRASNRSFTRACRPTRP